MFDLTQLDEMKKQQADFKKQAAECEKKMQKLQEEKKQLVASKKKRLLEMPLSKQVLEELNDLASTDPDIVKITETIEELAAQKQEIAEKEFDIATKIARILSE